jgi:hypothetical protein
VSLGLVIVLVLVAAVGGAAVGYRGSRHGRRAAHLRHTEVRRILLPFAGPDLPRRALEMSVRLAKADGATVVPAFLALVPRELPLDSPSVAQPSHAMALLDEIERRVSAQGVAVDFRVSRGRTYRDALRRLLEDERFERLIVAPPNGRHARLTGADLEWLLDSVPAEVLILRPAPDERGRTVDPMRRGQLAQRPTSTREFAGV